MMMEQVRLLLKRRDCLITLAVTQTEAERFIEFTLPERKIAPIFEKIHTRIDATPNGVHITANGEPQGFITLPTYAIRAFIMAIAIATCERFGYNKRLINFEIEGKQVEPVQWAASMLNFELDDETEKHDLLLRQLVTDASNCPIKYHSDFLARAAELGIDDGYKRVTHVLRGGNVYE